MDDTLQSYLLHVLRNPTAACQSVANTATQVNSGGRPMGIAGLRVVTASTEIAAPIQAPALAPASPLRAAAARVVPWSLSRAAQLLDRAARRPIRWGADTGAANPDEIVLLSMIRALSEADRDAALRFAEWLVRPHDREALLRALEPAADALRGQI